MKRKTILIICTVGLLLVLLVLGQSLRTNKIAGWNTLTNNNGWNIQYPPSWQVYGQDGQTAEEDEAPVIQGPKDCYDKGIRCGTIQIDKWAIDTKKVYYNMSPKQFLVEYQFKGSSSRKILSQRFIWIGGQLGYEITYVDSLVYGHPNGEISKVISIKYKDAFYNIWYSEDFKDESVIKTVGDWKLTKTFDQILSTFRFKN